MEPTEEQKKNRELAASGAITSTALAESPSVDFEEEKPTPVPAVGEPISLSQPEQQAQDLTQTLTELNKSLVGESAFQTEQEQAQGVAQKEQTVQDLTSQFNALAAEAKAIPVRLQQEAEGRGITAGGLAPIQASELRKNAIQALTVGSLLSAAQGNLNLAYQQVDRAVAAKFDPIREQIRVNLANLQLIKESPAFTEAQKNRAEQQAALQQQRQSELEKNETYANTIMKWALSAQQNGATTQEAQQLMDIALADKPNIRKAFSLISPYLNAITQDIDTQIVEVGGEKVLINSRTGETIKNLGSVLEKAATGDIGQYQQAQQLGLIPSSYSFFDFLAKRKKVEQAPETSSGLTKVQLFDRELKLASNFERITEDARDARRQQNQMEAGLSQAKTRIQNGESIAAASQAVLVTFQKVLDPTSVVRESEYARSASGLSLVGKIEGFATKLQAGGAGVSVKELQQFIDLGREFLKGYEVSTLNQAKLIKNQADSIGANLENVLPPDALDILTRKNTTVKIGDTEYQAGDILINDVGEKFMVRNDGNLELIEQ